MNIAVHFREAGWRSPVILSFLGHGFVVCAVLIAVWDRTGSVDLTEFEVYETPVPALSPLRPLAPKVEEKKTPRAVFGVSRSSVQSNSGLEVKAGNTVAKTPDLIKLKPEDAENLPIPTEEYLVSKMPELISDVRVPYPSEAKRKGLQGAVVFNLLIDGEGKVREATFIEGPGEGLNEAATDAVKRLRFKPALVEDRPVAVRIRYAYRFILER